MKLDYSRIFLQEVSCFTIISIHFSSQLIIDMIKYSNTYTTKRNFDCQWHRTKSPPLKYVWSKKMRNKFRNFSNFLRPKTSIFSPLLNSFICYKIKVSNLRTRWLIFLKKSTLLWTIFLFLSRPRSRKSTWLTANSTDLPLECWRSYWNKNRFSFQKIEEEVLFPNKIPSTMIWQTH